MILNYFDDLILKIKKLKIILIYFQTKNKYNYNTKHHLDK